MELLRYFVGAAQDLRLIGGFILLVLAALGWYSGLSRAPLTVAFPVAALSHPLMFLGAVVVLREDFSWISLSGNLLIVAGIFLATYGR